MEDVVRVIHLINPEDSLQAALVEGTVVGDQGEVPDQGDDLLPHVGEYRGVIGVLRPQAVHLSAEPLVVLRLGMYEAVERVHYPPAAYDDHPDAAHAGGLLVRRLEVYRREISHHSYFHSSPSRT